MTLTTLLAGILLGASGPASPAQPSPGGRRCVPCEPDAVAQFIEETQTAAERESRASGTALEESLCAGLEARGGVSGAALQDSVVRRMRDGVYDDHAELCSALARQRGSLSVYELRFRHLVFARDALVARVLRPSPAHGVHLSSVWATRPNVRVVRVPGCEDRVIFFNRRFFHFAQLGWRYLGGLVVRERAGKLTLEGSRASVVTSLRDPGAGERYRRFALGTLGRPQPRPPEGEHVSPLIGRAAELFTLTHELAHVTRGHDGPVAAAPEPPAPAPAGDTAWSGERVHRWAEELEADYHGTLLFAEALEEWNLDPALLRLVRWAPAFLLADLESYDHLQRLGTEPGAAPRWEEEREAETRFREGLRALPDRPETADFAAILSAHAMPGGEGRGHPPEFLRAEVVRLALLRAGLVSPAEYPVFSPADAWRLSLRTLYNAESARLRETLGR